MFDEKNQPVDIFADVDKVPPEGATAPAPVPQETMVVRRGPSKLLLLFVLLLLGGIGYGAYALFFHGKAPSSSAVATQNSNATGVNAPASATNSIASNPSAPTPAPNSPQPQTNQPSTNGVPVVNDNTGASQTNQPTPPAAAPSSAVDSKGFTAAEEATYGLNPSVADADGDGLTDYEEVKIYHTDPLNPDTDGDGYSDGAEVKSGYNPNGPGKLFQLPK